MKSRGENLEEHIQQAREYWDELEPKPRYVVLCNFDEFWIYDTTLQVEEPVNRVKLEELPQRYAALNFLFAGNSAVDDRRGNYCENIPPSGAVQLFGREQELERLHQLLNPSAHLTKEGEQQNKLRIAAIVGMGGVGKTELAMRYAWQHLQGLGDGAGGVCWVDGRDSDVGIQLVNFARSLLNLNPPEDWDLPTQLKYCWRNWQPGNWLIVIDDVTNYRQQVNPYKPPESSQFKVLLTTREELGRPVEHLPLYKLQPKAALDLLTSLVGVQRIQQELEIAEQLCRQLLDYLPLGLELVGRYLERDPDLSLKAMLSLLEKKRLRHRSVLEADSTMTARLGVADAFELSWERLDKNAHELRCLLSLFASADILWDLVKLTYSNMPSSEDEEIELDILEEARADLVRFNLLQRTGEGTYRLHQLIREFLREKRTQSAQENDLKQGFVAAMVEVATQISDPPTRQQIQKFAPAVLHVAEVAKDKSLWNLLHDEDLIEPFAGLGRFYQGQGFYKQAAYWLEQCLSVTQVRYGSEHPDVATSLNNLALLYHYTGCYSKAESMYLQALDLYNRLLGDKHIALANSLNNLAGLYASQSHYSEAEPLYLKTLELLKNLLGEENPRLANSLNNLAGLYESQGRYVEAEPLYLQALELNQRLLGDDHPDTVLTLGNLGSLYYSQELYSQAEPLLVQVLELNQRLLGEVHPRVIASLNNLAELYRCQDHHGKAEPLLVQALKLSKSLWGEEHPSVAITLNNLGLLYESQGLFSKAEPLYWQALAMRKRLLGEDHSKVATTLNNLAGLYYLQEFYSEAEFLWIQALEIFERRLGSGHPYTIECQKGLAMVRGVLNSTARDLPNFKQKAEKGGSKKKPKGFGKG
ncbi:MAG: tetratricopeptide repeat protein [Symplocastrum torsivum CPER-KK1]|uniref:Tetratricopeptide repeat protein n=1 Tax=Symplocastrum torsivum CPER-KK1 TaxID=450513 RepID=A0A951PP29_9CYAN|nr:tetratricopeptide repeat protein [Symplocastrum torsivum CPER-KK1]